MSSASFRPLDIIQSKDFKKVGIITEGVNCFSVRWLSGTGKSAWWTKEELTEGFNVIGNIPTFLVDNMAHPFGNNTKSGSQVYPVINKE